MKVFYILGWIGIIFGFIFVVLVTYWLTWPYNPITFSQPVFPILTPEVKQGGTLRFMVDYCKNTNMSATNSHAFVNALIFATPETTTNREAGCHDIVIGLEVPPELPPGKYHLQNIYKYQMNPIRMITIQHSTDSFVVTEK